MVADQPLCCCISCLAFEVICVDFPILSTKLKNPTLAHFGKVFRGMIPKRTQILTRPSRGTGVFWNIHVDDRDQKRNATWTLGSVKQNRKKNKLRHFVSYSLSIELGLTHSSIAIHV